jgi:DNA-binding NarL/FixJ family response regulator
VLIVEDHPIVRASLAHLVSQQPDLEVCGEAGSKADAIPLFHNTRPQLLLLDIVLSDGDGLDLCKEFRACDPQARILVISAQDDALYAERALHAGALGYVNKQSAVPVLLEAMRHVLAGKLFLSPPAAEEILARTLGQANNHSPYAMLSDRELEVFRLFGRGFTTPQIARLLSLSSKTIESSRERIKGKLGLATSTELIRHATRFVIEHP